MAEKSFIKDLNTAPPDELGHFRHHFSITMELEQHPMMMAMAAVAVGLILIYLFGRLRSGSTTINPIPAEPVNSTQPFIQQPVPVNVTVTNPNPPSSGGINLTIRSSGKAPTWDKAHAGVPFTSSPGGSLVSYIPWGTSVNQTGAPSSGPLSPKGYSDATSIYYLVNYNGKSGYISAWDVA